MIKYDRDMNVMNCNCNNYECYKCLILEEHGTGKGISRTKFLKEGENCDIPDLGNPSLYLC